MIEWIKNMKISFANFLALFVISMCFAFFFYISSSKFPVDLLKEVSDIKIALIGITTMVLGYYFGSSKSSHDKDETIKNQSKNE